LIALIICFFIIISGFYEDWLWFKDLGYEILFWKPILSKFIIQLINGSMLFILISAILLSGKHAFTTFYNERFHKKIRLVDEVNLPAITLSHRRVTIFILLVSGIISIIVSFIVGFTGWLDILYFRNSSLFNITDPIFAKDLSFYIFKLPFLLTIYNAFFSPILILTIFTTLFYMVTKVIYFNSFKIWQKEAVVINPSARKHLGILVSILFIIKAFGYYLSTFSLLYSQEGHVTGAGYTDIHATLPAIRISMILCVLAFIILATSIFVKDHRLITISIPLVIALSTLLNSFFPFLVQSLVVIPNELQKESEYIANEIRLTRYAYGLDKIEERDYPGNEPITVSDLEKEIETLNNIRLNDPKAVKQIYTQKQGIKLYYKFNDIDLDRYHINNKYHQIMVSPREISIEDLDPKAQTFINTRFKYTHGFGLAASFPNAVTSEGLPTFAIGNIPPISTHSELLISEPRIYFGELTNDWVVVNTTFKEFDYPQGNDNAENSYQGQTGIALTPLNKFMLSIHRGTPQFYFSKEVTSESKILLHRNILERVKKLAPFLKYDNNPYPVIDEGRIKWFIDGYSTASTLPYSSLYAEHNFNYIRNSVKIIIDAYDGTVDFYIIDHEDPILQTLSKIFPGVFKDIAEMPYTLRKHLKYPETLFKIQAEMLNTFHMTNTKVFYNKEDAWSIAKEFYGTKPQDIEPYYLILRLPGEEEEEFVLMQPFTPASSQNNARNNLIAWLVARMDDVHYGELILYKLPKNIEVSGPLQIESRIDQDPEISRQLALWNQKDSRVMRGNQLVIPVGGNFLYIKPIYLQSTTNASIPELVRIIIAYEDKISMSTSIEDALKQIFGSGVPKLSPLGENAIFEIQSPLETETNNLKFEDLIEQIQQIRDMLDDLENQLMDFTDQFLSLEEDDMSIERQ